MVLPVFNSKETKAQVLFFTCSAQLWERGRGCTTGGACARIVSLALLVGENGPIISASWQSAIWAGPLGALRGEGGSPRSWEARVGVGCAKGC